jgi:TonB family protein
MKLRKAFALSLAVHAGAMALAFCLGTLGGNTESKVSFSIEAPLGSVFVREEESSESAPAEANDRSRPLPSPEPGIFLRRTKEAGGSESPSEESAPGTPEGEAEPLGKIEPVYPPLSRRLGEEGEAVFLLTIEASGKVSAAQLEKSSGSGRLDEAARSALLGALFRPAESAGRQAASSKRFRIEFRLEGSGR